MKIQNSIPWCNLFSTASKYNLCIKESRYRYLVILSGCTFSILLLIIYVTYAYLFVLVSVIFIITLLSLFSTKKKNEQLSTLQIIVDELGVCSFENIIEKKAESDKDLKEKEQFQLLSSSRYSFLGCWLYLVPLSNLYSSSFLIGRLGTKPEKKRLFVYRDSLSAEDFSKLSRVIRNLK